MHNALTEANALTGNHPKMHIRTVMYVCTYRPLRYRSKSITSSSRPFRLFVLSLSLATGWLFVRYVHAASHIFDLSQAFDRRQALVFIRTYISIYIVRLYRVQAGARNIYVSGVFGAWIESWLGGRSVGLSVGRTAIRAAPSHAS